MKIILSECHNETDLTSLNQKQLKKLLKEIKNECANYREDRYRLSLSEFEDSVIGSMINDCEEDIEKIKIELNNKADND